jgi:hypothetical protein
MMTIDKKLKLVAGACGMLLLSLGGFSISTMRNVRSGLRPVSQEYLPDVRLTGSIERDVLNARIHFIYFATIRKPGARELGWARYQKAKEGIKNLQHLLQNSEALASLA